MNERSTSWSANAKSFDLTGRVALVTGGNRGLGLGMSLGLANAGATVVIASRQKANSLEALLQLQKIEPSCDFVRLNVLSEKSCIKAVEEVASRLKRIDILINNAGISVRKPPESLTEAEWNSVVGTNLTGAFRCAKAAHQHLKKAGGGKIINIASMYSLFGAPLVAAYAASKGGLMQLTRSLAAAWAQDNIQVNAIIPGWLDTEMTRDARLQVSGLHESVLQRTPAARWGIPEDMVGAAVFLASDASNFVTGASLTVDGGYSIRG